MPVPFAAFLAFAIARDHEIWSSPALMDFSAYEPTRPEWLNIWERLSAASRKRRFEGALKRKAALDEANATINDGCSERASVGGLSPAVDRSNWRRWKRRYERYGFDGLVSWSLPPAKACTPEAVRVAICTLRRSDPNKDVDEIVRHVERHHNFKTSGTSVKRILREAGLGRRPGPASGKARVPEKSLAFGGMQLVSAALVETGYLEAIGQTVASMMDTVDTPTGPLDNEDRDWGDEFGRVGGRFHDPEFVPHRRTGPMSMEMPVHCSRLRAR